MEILLAFVRNNANRNEWKNLNMLKKIMMGIAIYFLLTVDSVGHDLVDVVKKVKPSVVGIGVYTPLGQPRNSLHGSGFVVADGRYVMTNHHVISKELDLGKQQELVVFVGSGKTATVRKAKLIGASQYHDLALLKIEGSPLPAVKLGTDQHYPEGSLVGFTGFPIGSILGLYPVTHRGIIASVTPVVIPVPDTRQLSLAMLKQMKNPYMVYQLDATAYPGNSGSALYDAASGVVIGVINKVFVQDVKEGAISNPSGITYAIPVKHVRALLQQHNVTP